MLSNLRFGFLLTKHTVYVFVLLHWAYPLGEHPALFFRIATSLLACGTMPSRHRISRVLGIYELNTVQLSFCTRYIFILFLKSKLFQFFPHNDVRCPNLNLILQTSLSSGTICKSQAKGLSIYFVVCLSGHVVTFAYVHLRSSLEGA